LEEGRIATERAERASPETKVAKADLMQVLGDVMNRLPVEQRSALLLREYHGFTSDEIGEITGVPAATVRTRIFYGLRSVRRMLQQRGAE